MDITYSCMEMIHVPLITEISSNMGASGQNDVPPLWHENLNMLNDWGQAI